MMQAYLLIFALGAVLSSPCAWAGTSPDNSPLRQLIADETAAIEARHVERVARCLRRFAVTDCVEAARRDRRNALRPLREETLRLDDADRQRRAAQRLQEIQDKLDEHAASSRSTTAPTDPVPPAVAGEIAPADPPMPRSGTAKLGATEAGTRAAETDPLAERAPTARRIRPVPDLAARQRAEAENRARFEARKKAIEDRREAVEQRNAERAREGKRVRPLPVPSGVPPAASAP